MENIYLNNTGKGLSFDEFERSMTTICKKHYDEKRALAFAFILYDFTNPEVVKILKDQDYWNALNEISGKYLTVFSLHYNPKPTIQLKDSMESIETNYTPKIATNILIKKYFGEDVQIKYPAILFFQVDGDEVIDSYLVELNNSFVESAFNELKTLIERASIGIKKSIEEDYDNKFQIFDLLVYEFDKARFIKSVKKIPQTAKKILGLAQTAQGVVSTQ